VIWLLLTWVALAQQTPVSEELTVWGESAIQSARSAIVVKMRSMGYRSRDLGGGNIRFRPPERWMGRAHLDREGDLTFGRPVLAAAETTQVAEVERSVSGDEPLAVDRSPATVNASVYWWFLPSWRVLAPAHERVRQHVGEELRTYRETVRLTAFHLALEELPDRMDALWNDGAPLEGSRRLSSMPARRAALLAFWAGRADTAEGLETSQAVEAFLREVVQHSEHPITPEELGRAESDRADGRALDLD